MVSREHGQSSADHIPRDQPRGFQSRDWARFVSIGLIWGASFLFIESASMRSTPER